MIEQQTASERITQEVTSWPGVEAGYGRRGEFGFRLGRREIGHLHGDRVAHFTFPKDLGAELREQGRVGPHPVNPDSPKLAARTIESEEDVREVIALMRLNYDRLVAHHGLPGATRDAERPVPTTMKAVAIDRFGGLDEIRLRTLPVPAVGPDEVLIRVDTADVGVWDPWDREGFFAEMTGRTPSFPYVLGGDGSGIVVAVGERVTRLRVGDRVYAYGPDFKARFYAEYAAAKAENVALVPTGLSLEEAGAMSADAITAFYGLDRVLDLQPGETLLVFGASGGVGHLAVQFAKRMGARVFGVASGEDGVAFVRRLGADGVVEGYTGDVAAAARAFAPDGFDAALLTAGGEAAEQALTTLRDGGRVAYPNGVEPRPEARPHIDVQAYDGRVYPGLFEKMNRLIEAGPFTVHVARTFSLEEAAAAHRALGEHYLGKLALKVADTTDNER